MFPKMAARRGGAGFGDDEGHAVESIYADKILSDGLYATRNGDLYKWLDNHFSPLPDELAQREAFEWLRDHPKKRTASKAVAAVDAAKLAVRQITPMKMGSQNGSVSRFIIPTEGKWLEVVFGVDENGRSSSPRVFYMDPVMDAGAAVLSTVPVRMDGVAGDEYHPSPISATSIFGRFLASSFPTGGLRLGDDSPQHLDSAEALMAVQEYAGYTLLLGKNDQKAHLWMGEGANGKGVMSGLIQKFHRTISVDLSYLDGFALAGLPDATLAVVDETPKDSFNEGRFKSIIGAGLVPIDRKFKSMVNAVTEAKWIINSNQEFGIRCRNSTSGFWRRFVFIEWKHVIPVAERREGLDNLIFNLEGASVFDWMLAGALRYLSRGGLFEPEASGRIKKAAMSNSDIVGGWVGDLGGIANMLTPPRSKTSTKDDVYGAFRSYCEANGRQSINSHEFWVRVKKVFGDTLSDTQGKNAEGRMVRWINIDLSAREGTGHLTAPAFREIDAPEFRGSGVAIPSISLLAEIYGIDPSKIDALPSISAETAANGATPPLPHPVSVSSAKAAAASLIKPATEVFPGIASDRAAFLDALDGDPDPAIGLVLAFPAPPSIPAQNDGEADRMFEDISWYCNGGAAK